LRNEKDNGGGSRLMPNQKYYDEERDFEDGYDPIFDFRPSKWLYERLKEANGN